MDKIKKIKLVVILCFCVLGACARLDYIKVPTPTQYSNWTDEQQERADNIKGVRYYLPRPFLHLKQSVPVAQRVAFISFRFETRTVNNETEQGYYLQMPDNPPTWLQRLAPERISVSQALAISLLSERTVRDDDPNDGEEAALAGADDEDTDGAEDRPATELTASTGFISDTDPVTRLSNLMDVVYLPDFEEQYVIKIYPGIGQANIETRLRNGWAAEVFSQQIDNSNLIPYVIRQVESASEAAAGIATTWMPMAAGLPPGTSPMRLSELAAAVTGEEAAVAGDIKPVEAAEILGQILLFKIAEVKMAQPGVYPILKPREINQWLKTTAQVSDVDPQATFELFLKQNNLPWIRPDMAFIPAPPFTMIGFNVTTDAFLMPATERLGVSDVPPPTTALKTDEDSWEKDKETIENVLKATLATAMPGLEPKFKKDDDTYDVIADKARNGADTKITIRTKNIGTTLTDEDKADKTFKAWVKTTFKNVSDGQIDVIYPNDKTVEITVSVSPGTLAKNKR